MAIFQPQIVGKGGSNQDIQYDVMPEATIENLGRVIQYVGDTIPSTEANACFPVCYSAVMGTKKAFHSPTFQPLIISAFLNSHIYIGRFVLVAGYHLSGSTIFTTS